MNIIWLGQAGLLIEIEEQKIVIDPYLSDSVGEMDPQKHRRVAVQRNFLNVEPDVLLFTHDHLDHYDPQTVEQFVKKKKPMTVLAPGTCWQKARAYGGNHNYVLFDRGTEWTQGNVRFTAVTAVHSDAYAIGVLVQGEGKTLYITGDTLYSRKILEELPRKIDAIFLPVNGVGNNMNMVDAARFAADSGAKVAVPIHFGLFDGLDPNEFPATNKVIPKIFEQIELRR